MASRFVYQAVHKGEVKYPLFRLEQLPGDWCQYSIQIHLNKFWPDRLHVLQTGGTGIVEFASQDQKGLPVHYKLCRGPLFNKAGNSLYPEFSNAGTVI